ncbi:hypothetical protein VPD39_03860, partial [Burkholderia vietnamiensis]|nr:hypothetical protein [Burkholderia vietnamiensis]
MPRKLRAYAFAFAFGALASGVASGLWASAALAQQPGAVRAFDRAASPGEPPERLADRLPSLSMAVPAGPAVAPPPLRHCRWP